MTHNGDVANGGSYNQSASLTVPVGLAGIFSVYVVANSSNNLPTSSSDGNTAAAPNAVQIQLAPPADLAVGTVTIPASGAASAGQNVAISYQVTNRGGNPANGSWYDAIYLSTTPTWSASDPLLGRVFQSRDLLPAQSYTGSLTAAVPGLAPGPYFVIVRTNVLGSFPEVNLTNNANASAAPLAIDAPALTLGTPTNGTLSQDQSTYYKVVVPAGQTLQVAINTPSSGAFNELYVSYGTMPTRSQYLYRYSEPFAGDQTVTVPTTQAGTYYVLAYANTVPAPPESYAIEADLIPFSVQSVAPNQVGAGPVTLEIDGAQFTSGVTFQLQGASGTLNASRVIVRDSATAFATFDLTGRALGSYAIVASQAGQSPVILNAAVTVAAATTSNAVKLGIIEPQAVLVGRPGTITITYDNPGNTDLPAPVIFVNSTNVLFQVPGQSGYSSASLQLFGSNPHGPFGTLPPGFQGTITIPFEPETAGAGLASGFSLQALANPSEPFPWSAFAAGDVPAKTSPQEWAIVVAQAEAAMGDTWGSVVSFLGTSSVLLAIDQPGQTDPMAAEGLFNFDALLQYVVGTYGSTSPAAAVPSLPIVASQGQVTLYNGNLDGSGNPAPLNQSFPTFVLVPGFGGYQSSFASLAAAIAADAASYPNGRVNVLIASWSGAAAGPTIDGQTVPWESALDVAAAGSDLGSLLTQLNQQGDITFSTTTVIGQGSGNDVGNQAAQIVGGLAGIVALNPEAALGGFVPVDLTPYFQASAAYETSSLFGLQGSIAASNQTLPTGDLNDPVAQQTYGIGWLTQQILAGDDGLLNPRLSTDPDAIPGSNNPALLPSPTAFVVNSAQVLQITSVDPDSIIGPIGSGANAMVPISSPMPYTITFTNTSPTQAPAQVVSIVENIDPPNLNWESFELTGFGFNGQMYSIPSGDANYQTTLHFNGYDVNFFANIDESTGTATWSFTSIDPSTGVTPTNPTIGFLPADTASGDADSNIDGMGEGFVMYSIMPSQSDATGTQITAQATVTFDQQPPLETNEAINTVDAGSGLASMIQPLATVQTDTQFNVNWGGMAAPNSSGIGDYTTYVSDNGGAYTPWLTNTPLTTAQYTGQDGHTYSFYTTATDNVGNVQSVPTAGQATTTVDATPPASSVATLPSFSSDAFTVRWSGTDDSGIGIAHYDVYVAIDGGPYSLWQSDTTDTSASYTGTSGHSYSFYSVATDNAGIAQSTPASAQATTTVDALAPVSSVKALATFNLGSFPVSWSGSDNGGSGIAFYDVYVSDNGGALTRWQAATTSTTATYSGVDGHNYAFSAVATDALGNVQPVPATAQAATTVDTTAPASTVTALPSFSPGTFTVKWPGSDGGSGIAYYDLYVSDNGGAFTRWQTATNSAAATYTGTTGHSYGFYSVATDELGNAQSAPASAQATTTVDAAAPSSSVASLPSFSPGTFTVTWSGSDGGSGIASYDVYAAIDGGAFSLWQSDTTQTSASYPGSNGHGYGFYSVATDKVGNVQATPASAQATTTVDAAAPSSSVASLPSFSPGVFTVTWSGSDGGSGIASYDVYVSIDGGAFSLWQSNTTQTSALYPGSDGHRYGFYAVATDKMGNVQATPVSDQATTTADATAPTSSVAALPSLSPGAIAVSWSGSDGSGSGIASYDVFVSDNSGAFTRWQTATTSTNAAYPSVDGHTYGFYAVATDKVGNVQTTPASAQATTTADAVAPTSRVASLPSLSSANFPVSWSGSDSGSGIASFDVYVSDNGGVFSRWLSATNLTTSIYPGANGHSYGFYSVATDRVGNVQETPASAQATTAVDGAAPTSSVASLPTVSLGNFPVSWSGSDGSGLGIASYDVYVSDNGGSFTRWLTGTTLTTAPYSGGVNGHSYGFYSVATDKLGNVQSTPTSAQATTMVDAAAPTSSVSVLPSFSASRFTVSWSGSDGTGSGIASYDVYVSDDGGSFIRWLPGTALTAAQFTGLNGHSYGFYAVATDLAGNVQPTSASAQATTSVDAAAPTSSVSNLPSFSLGTFAVTWSGTDGSGSGIASYDIYVSDDGGTFARWLTATTLTTATFTGLNGHSYGFYSVATDKVGNVQAAPTASQASTAVDAAAPTSRVSALPSSSPATFTVTWSGNDGSGSGIASYDVYVSVDGAAFTRWQTATMKTAATCVGTNGHSYGFYSVAMDKVGNVQSTPASAQADTVVALSPPPPVSPPPPTANLIGVPQFAVGADSGSSPAVTIYNSDGSVKSEQSVFSPSFTGGVRTAMADFNGDGTPDIAVGTGPGTTAEVELIDGKTGSIIFDVKPFDTFQGGVFIAAGDIDGDGKAELVITPDQSGGPRVEIYEGGTFQETANFFGIADPGFRGGARAALGDINGDGHADLVVSAGFGGGPRISVYDGAALAHGQTTNMVSDFFAFSDQLRNGAYVAVGDVTGDGHDDLIFGAGPGGGPQILIVDGESLLTQGVVAAVNAPVASYFAGDPNNRGGVRVTVKNLDADRFADVVVGAGQEGGSGIAAYLGKRLAVGDTAEDFGFDAFPGFTGGVFVG